MPSLHAVLIYFVSCQTLCGRLVHESIERGITRGVRRMFKPLTAMLTDRWRHRRTNISIRDYVCSAVPRKQEANEPISSSSPKKLPVKKTGARLIHSMQSPDPLTIKKPRTKPGQLRRFRHSEERKRCALSHLSLNVNASRLLGRCIQRNQNHSTILVDLLRSSQWPVSITNDRRRRHHRRRRHTHHGYRRSWACPGLH